VDRETVFFSEQRTTPAPIAANRNTLHLAKAAPLLCNHKINQSTSQTDRVSLLTTSQQAPTTTQSIMKMPSSFLLLFSILPSLTLASFSTTISNDDPDFLDLLEDRGFDKKASPFGRTSQTPGSPTLNPQNQPALAEEKNTDWDASSDSEESFNPPTFSYDWNSPKTKKRSKKKQGTTKKMMMSKPSTKNNHPKPSSSPSVKPSTARIPEPTKQPSLSPSVKPSIVNSPETAKPSSSPSPKPSKSPETAKPSSSPSVEPPTTKSPEPTNPSSPPSVEPSATRSPEPTPMATEDEALVTTDPPSLSRVISFSVPTAPPYSHNNGLANWCACATSLCLFPSPL